jgi:hypothetical protein
MSSTYSESGLTFIAGFRSAGRYAFPGATPRHAEGKINISLVKERFCNCDQFVNAKSVISI